MNPFNEYRTSLFAVVVFFMLFPFLSFSQPSDTLVLVNGKILPCSNISKDSVFVYYQKVRGNGKVKKQSQIDLEMVFSIRYSDREEILYNPSEEELFSGNFTVDQMRFFVLGQQDARANYKTHWWSVGGVAICGSLAYFSYDQIYVAAIPFAYTLTAGITPVNVHRTSNRTNYELRKEAYQLGYLRAAKSKRVFRALQSSLLGTAIGVGVGYATN